MLSLNNSLFTQAVTTVNTAVTQAPVADAKQVTPPTFILTAAPAEPVAAAPVAPAPVAKEPAKAAPAPPPVKPGNTNPLAGLANLLPKVEIKVPDSLILTVMAEKIPGGKGSNLPAGAKIKPEMDKIVAAKGNVDPAKLDQLRQNIAADLLLNGENMLVSQYTPMQRFLTLISQLQNARTPQERAAIAEQIRLLSLQFTGPIFNGAKAKANQILGSSAQK